MRPRVRLGVSAGFLLGRVRGVWGGTPRALRGAWARSLPGKCAPNPTYLTLTTKHSHIFKSKTKQCDIL